MSGQKRHYFIADRFNESRRPILALLFAGQLLCAGSLAQAPEDLAANEAELERLRVRIEAVQWKLLR